ncbi:MAG: hypothetical protein JW863_12390 [Chitinispirillaceae bacterium]|nr:hypothetical protein [Chitinispirillaceae bacterium]
MMHQHFGIFSATGNNRMITMLALLCVAGTVRAKTAVPLFLFSGQSNMVCLGSAVSDLPAADRNKTYENIKIDNRSDNASQAWSTLKPGFGGDANHFGPELYFGKVLSDSMPDTKFAFIKDATSGTYLGQSGGWLPPSSGGPGTLYRNMMNHIDRALAKFNDAFDTSEYTPRWAGFIWHQGEFDAWNDQSLANKYEQNLTNLIKDIREKAEDDSMPAIIPMITGSMWQYQDIVRAAEIAVAHKLVNTDTTDTKGFALANDNIHFNAASQIKIGTNCALRWLAMDYTNTWWGPVPVVYQPAASTPAMQFSGAMTLYDLAGRKIGMAAIQNTGRSEISSSLTIMAKNKSGYRVMKLTTR